MNHTLSSLFVVSAVFAQTVSFSQAAATAAQQAAVVTSDAATKTVRLNLVAGQGAANNGLNYNGSAKGEKTLTVPLGWTVEVDCPKTLVVSHAPQCKSFRGWSFVSVEPCAARTMRVTTLVVCIGLR